MQAMSGVDRSSPIPSSSDLAQARRDNVVYGTTYIGLAVACFSLIFLLAFTIYAVVSGLASLLFLGAGIERFNR